MVKFIIKIMLGYLKDFFDFPRTLMETYDLYGPQFHSIEKERSLKILLRRKATNLSVYFS